MLYGLFPYVFRSFWRGKGCIGGIPAEYDDPMHIGRAGTSPLVPAAGRSACSMFALSSSSNVSAISGRSISSSPFDSLHHYLLHPHYLHHVNRHPHHAHRRRHPQERSHQQVPAPPALLPHPSPTRVPLRDNCQEYSPQRTREEYDRDHRRRRRQ